MSSCKTTCAFARAISTPLPWERSLAPAVTNSERTHPAKEIHKNSRTDFFTSNVRTFVMCRQLRSAFTSFFEFGHFPRKTNRTLARTEIQLPLHQCEEGRFVSSEAAMSYRAVKQEPYFVEFLQEPYFQNSWSSRSDAHEVTDQADHSQQAPHEGGCAAHGTSGRGCHHPPPHFRKPRKSVGTQRRKKHGHPQIV